MLFPPLAFTDVSSLLALSAITLLIAAEITSPHYGMSKLTINREKLRNAALVSAVLFFITIAIKLIGIINF